MSESHPSIRQEVRDYLVSCEYLLAAASSPDHVPLSNEEREVIALYADKVLMAIPQATY